MNNEMNEKKAVTLEDLLMELVKEGKAVRIPIGKAAIQPDKAEANKEQEAGQAAVSPGHHPHRESPHSSG